MVISVNRGTVACVSFLPYYDVNYLEISAQIEKVEVYSLFEISEPSRRFH